MAVRFGVLGPLVAVRAGVPVDLRGPRHRAVLARLLAAGGRVVPVSRLVDDLWEVPPAGAVGALQTFVSALRRALEPDRPPRAPARLLVTAAPGYALRADPSAVDAWQFEATVTTLGDLLARHHLAAEALADADRALESWRGPAYAEFADHAWARAEITRLDELRLLAVERRAEALLALDRPADAVPDLRAHTDAHPWREDAWRLLALAHYRAGHQADALDTLRNARRALADQLGIDPTPGLRHLESDILRQSPHLLPHHPRSLPPPPADPPISPPPSPLVCREEEVARLVDAASAAVDRGRLGLALVSGEAGAGKTALAEAVTTQLAARGWTVAWAGNPDTDDLPAAWPWTHILTTLSTTDPLTDLTGDPGVGGDGVGGDGVGDPGVGGDGVVVRFRWRRAVAGRLAEVAGRGPLVVVLDDLHWAGEETLALLAALVADPVPGPVLLVATYRSTDVPPALTDLLGRVARAEPTRVYLGGLPVAAVADLVRATTGQDVDGATARAVHQRTGGNPFFVRELARLLAAEGTGALASVPAGVRDVVRYRLARLPATVQQVLRQAAVLGTDIELDVLAALSGGAAPTLAAAETATHHGFLEERAPRRFRFAHALVRDTVYHDISASRRAAAHAAAAETIERLHPDDVESLAHHFLLADDPATADRAARYTREAATRAEHRVTPHEAARRWQAALTADARATAAGSGAGGERERLGLVMGLVRALAVAGSLDRARERRAEALELAAGLDDPALTAEVIGAFDVPAVWTDNDDPALARRIAELAERALWALPPDRLAERARLLATIALELRNTGGDRAREAAREAETLARRCGDPRVLAFALNARFMQLFQRAGLATERARVGAELVELAARHRLVTFEVLGHLILVQSAAAVADLATADEHAAAADRLGETYQLPLVGVLTQWYRALRTALTGDPTAAEAAYRAAAARLPGTGMSGLAAGLLPLALLCLRLANDQPIGELDGADFGPNTPWCRPLLRLAAGDRAGAAAAAATIPDAPRDLLYEARTCLHAITALALDDRPTMRRLHTDLLPAATELAGATTGLLTLRPVAHYLAALSTALHQATTRQVTTS